MSSTSKIKLSPTNAGAYNLKPDEAVAAKVSELLQENHDKYHVYTHPMGTHNHIVHHLLTLYALDTSPEDVEKHYQRNASYQRPKILPATEALKSYDNGPYGTYNQSLEFFSKKIDELGVAKVFEEYVLKEGHQEATELLERLYFLHPLISVGFGIEYNQPSIVAEGLAMASVADPKGMGGYTSGAEAIARLAKSEGKAMEGINEEIRHDAEIIAVRNAVGPSEFADKILNGPLIKCPEKAMKYMSEWRVEATQEAVEMRLAELINCSARGVAGAAANHYPKIVKFDFLQIHQVTSWYATYVLCQQPWISIQSKARLVEYQGRAELLFYLLSGVAGINTEAYEQYDLKILTGDDEKDWEDVLRRSTKIEDDGHSSKLIRTLALGRKVCKPYERKTGDSFKLHEGDWIKIANLAVESLQPPLRRWVRFGGYKSSWDEFPDKE